MNGTDFYSQAADWVVTTARRRPEALLLVAAGVALMMRGGGATSWSRPADPHGRAAHHQEKGLKVPLDGSGSSYPRAV